MGFPFGSVVKNLPANTEASAVADLIPGLGRFPGQGHGNPLQYSCLGNHMDRGDWQTTVHRIAKNQTRLRDYTTNNAGWILSMVLEVTVLPKLVGRKKRNHPLFHEPRVGHS